MHPAAGLQQSVSVHHPGVQHLLHHSQQGSSNTRRQHTGIIPPTVVMFLILNFVHSLRKDRAVFSYMPDHKFVQLPCYDIQFLYGCLSANMRVMKTCNLASMSIRAVVQAICKLQLHLFNILECIIGQVLTF